MWVSFTLQHDDMLKIVDTVPYQTKTIATRCQIH